MLTRSVWLSVLSVLALLFFFCKWYISAESGLNNFYLLIIFFSVNILALAVTPLRLIFLIFWECLGISSYLLVRWWRDREQARTLALVRLVASRIRDACFFTVFIFIDSIPSLFTSLMAIIAVASKSAQLFFFPWLLRAIERPGPVSALLHSSTLVLARVILGYRLNELDVIQSPTLVAGVIGLVLRVFGVVHQIDIKQRIACSTVYNIRLIFIWIALDQDIILVLHLILHAFLKASTFVTLRIFGHITDTQDTRCISNNSFKQVQLSILFTNLALSFIPLIRLRIFKEINVEFLQAEKTSFMFYVLFLSLLFLGLTISIELVIKLINPNNVLAKFIVLPKFLLVYINIVRYSLLVRLLLILILHSSNLTRLNRFVLLFGVALVLIHLISIRSSNIEFLYILQFSQSVLFHFDQSKIVTLREYSKIKLQFSRNETSLLGQHLSFNTILIRIFALILSLLVIFNLGLMLCSN